MESYIVAYIAQRMANLGFTKYSFEPLLYVLSPEQHLLQFDGMNEYYYLVSALLATGTEISSGNNYFRVEDCYSKLDFSKIQEFTGQVQINSPQDVKQVIEFIRVIPQYHGKEQVHA